MPPSESPQEFGETRYTPDQRANMAPGLSVRDLLSGDGPYPSHQTKVPFAGTYAMLLDMQGIGESLSIGDPSTDGEGEEVG